MIKTFLHSNCHEGKHNLDGVVSGSLWYRSRNAALDAHKRDGKKDVCHDGCQRLQYKQMARLMGCSDCWNNDDGNYILRWRNVRGLEAFGAAVSPFYGHAKCISHVCLSNLPWNMQEAYQERCCLAVANGIIYTLGTLMQAKKLEGQAGLEAALLYLPHCSPPVIPMCFERIASCPELEIVLRGWYIMSRP